MVKNILVTGANGQLGSEIKYVAKNKYYKDFNLFFTDKNSLDITDFNAVEAFIKEIQKQVAS